MDDVLDEIASEEKRQGVIQAEAIARQRQRDAEYRARITAEANERLGRIYSNLDELGDLIPRLWLALGDFNRNVAEINEKGLGFDHGGLIEDTLCVPVDFASKMLAAIKDAAPLAVWDYSATGPLGKGKKAERPKLRGAQEIRLPRFYNGPPPGYSGLWDVANDRPIDGEGTSGMFLP